MNVACPQCGNPNLDVDAANNIVYCKKCGFSVQVDPATGNVTPISQGGAGGAAPAAGAPVAASSGIVKGKMFGYDAITVFLGGAVLLAILQFSEILDFSIFVMAFIVWFLYYWWHH